MQIQHDTENNRFYIPLESGKEAELKYRLLEDGVDLYSTYVPNSERGNGYASALVKATLKWAKTEEHEVHASCWYVRDYLNKKELVKKTA